MFITIVAIVVVLSVVILIHEVGHFVSAKKTGTKVEEFGIGYPPRIFGVKKGDTLYSINWIPFGGFVKIKGSEGADDHEGEADSFVEKPIWQRALMLGGGVVMNFILAIILLSIAYMIGSPGYVGGEIDQSAQVTEEKIQVLTVEEGFPAKDAGFQAGDAIVSINGNEFTNTDELNLHNQGRANQEIIVVLNRDNELIETKLTLTQNDEGKGVMGVTLVETGLIRYPFFKSIWLGFKDTFLFVWIMLKFLYSLIRDLLVGKSVAGEITGPIGVAFLTSKVVKLGMNYVLQFTAIISINLGLFNLLPFPALDGSRLVFLGIEKIRRKRVSMKVENMFHTIGFGLLIILSIFIAVKDWQRFFGK